MKGILAGLALLALAACGTSPPRHGTTYDLMKDEMAKAEQSKPAPAQPASVQSALLPPLAIEMPRGGAKPVEQRFDLVVNNAPASEVLMAIVSGTPYSMLVHPDVKGSLSVNLRDVTVPEALQAVHDMYGFEYRVEGRRITVQPASMQTRVFQVNYLPGARKGTSELTVTSSALTGTGAGTLITPTTATTGSSPTQTIQSSKVSTTSNSDFWDELTKSLQALVGTGDGRSVVVSPQSGVVVVRAMPREIKAVEAYLDASQITVERQVMLEAKIIEVELRDGYEAGVNWAAFRTGHSTNVSAGQVSPGVGLGPTGTGPLTGDPFGTVDATTGLVTGVTPGSNLAALPSAAGTLFGLALQATNFAALISFLETQGIVHVLSSPRIATINNQKAVLKVGADELFVTNVSSTTTTGTATTTTPTVTLQSFFSGVALDITPRIDAEGMITLHVHPSISRVQQVERQIELTGTLGTITIPVPRSEIQETDSIVRVQDGQVVAIGGLMTQIQTEDRSGVPGASDLPVVGGLFRNVKQRSRKLELVILVKPTLIKSSRSWSDDLSETRGRFEKLDRGFSWGSKSEVFGTEGGNK